MITCGIVCEYNPFHNGHAYQIREIRRLLGEDTAIVCIMSGDFVQRGDIAVYPKHDRARAAVCGGANLVFELPLPWSISSAESFARGAVGLLGAMGNVSHLCFGSESGDVNVLEQISELVLRPEIDELIRLGLGKGVSYATARQKALERLNGAALPQLSNPNDILAVEYLKAIRLQKLDLQPIAIQRIGAGHDSEDKAAIPSASMLRRKLRSGEGIEQWMPNASADTLKKGRGAVSEHLVETAVLSRLRLLTEADFYDLPDATEGLEHRLFRVTRTESSLEAIAEAAASKRYPKARIRRMALCAALKIRAGDNVGIPPYLRLLAADRRGINLLRTTGRTSELPLITKPASARKLQKDAGRIFALGADAADLYSLGYLDPTASKGGSDWRTSPFVVP